MEEYKKHDIVDNFLIDLNLKKNRIFQKLKKNKPTPSKIL